MSFVRKGNFSASPSDPGTPGFEQDTIRFARENREIIERIQNLLDGYGEHEITDLGGSRYEVLAKWGGYDNPRPFAVNARSATTVVVNEGYVHWEGSWVTPTWEGTGGFGELNEHTKGTKLQFRVDVAVGAGDVSTTQLRIGWDLSAPYEALPSRAYDIDFVGSSVTETDIDGQILIDIYDDTASANLQIIDYNLVLPWNHDIDTTVTATGGTT